MIRVNMDYDPVLSRKYDIDGQYVPRVLFLDPAGKVLRNIYPGGRNRFSAVNTQEKLLDMMDKAREAVAP